MKCPYRVQVNKTIITNDYKKAVNEEINFEDCYEEECPFYNSFEDTCARAVQEAGGGL